MATVEDPVTRLDTFFAGPPKVQNQATAFGVAYYGNQYAPGNEHDLGAPLVYTWAGPPDRTAAVTRAAVGIYTPTPDGLPGNDDLGALSGWAAWALMGLQPAIPGAPLYVIGSPAFDRVAIGDLVVEVNRTTPLDTTVQTATLAGQPLDRAWLTESELAAGPLQLTLGPGPSTWATAPEARPPSVSTDPLSAFGCAVS